MNTRNYFVVDNQGFVLRADGKDGRRLGWLVYDHRAHPVPRAAFGSRTSAIQAARDFGLKKDEFWVVSTTGEI